MSTLEAPRQWLSALAELVMPRHCVGCAAPATWWCPVCADAVERPVSVRTVGGPGAPGEPGGGGSASVAGVTLRVHAAAPYRGPAGGALIAWKERGVGGLTAPLADALTRAVLDACAGVPGAVALVPVPSRPGALRDRGSDVVAGLARASAARLRCSGLDVVAVPALLHARRVRDQAGLGALERASNVDGAMRVRRNARRPLRTRRVVVVDDVVTTGATLAEAARALRRDAGIGVVAAATVAFASADRAPPR